MLSFWRLLYLFKHGIYIYILYIVVYIISTDTYNAIGGASSHPGAFPLALGSGVALQAHQPRTSIARPGKESINIKLYGD